MGNNIYVDRTPSSIEKIISYPISKIEESTKEINNQNNSYQHINLWSLNENNSTIPNKNTKDENSTISIKTNPIELSIIHKSRFLLDSQNVYIILLIFKKDKENLIENSPFPTGLWGIIESSSNMTPRGLLYAFPNNNSQNLESFLLSKRELEDSEFKYMLFIWNGKKASAYLRSIALMKAFDLDKALSNSNLVQFLYNGFYINDNFNLVERSEPINMGDIINNTIQNSEDSIPSSEKISNFHETVYLFKWLYPIYDKEKKKKKDDKLKPKDKILFKGFNTNFLEKSEKKDFYNNFTYIDFKSNQNNKNQKFDNEDNNNNNNYVNFVKSSLINSNNKIKVMPPKLNLNLNLNKNLNDLNRNDKLSKLNEEIINENLLDDDTNLYLDLINNDNNNKENQSKIKIGQIQIPKLMVSLQRNILNDDIITERSKKKAEEEDSLNEIPESIIIKASDHILNEESNGINIKALNENYNLKDGERKKIINDYYSKHLSEIIPNFLYLSSYNAAKNKELIDKNKITNIINCAADFCNNDFSNEPNLNYLSFYLKDHVMENIECIFYECIEYIESVKEKNGRVLIHCIQGISRSVSIVMAYLIYKNKYTYDKAFSLVQSKREISSPNFGFSIQLQNFYLRLYEPIDKYRYIPKIFAVGSFQNEQPCKIVCRLINEPFFEIKENAQTRMFDKRGIFIIVSINNIYIWIGSKINLKMKDIYLDNAKNYIKLLQKYENAPKNDIIYINEGNEDDNFLNDLLKNNEKISKFKYSISDIFSDWNNWYKDISLCNKNNKKDNLNLNIKVTHEQIKKGFFLYPNEIQECVIDFDDLSDDEFLIACVYQNQKGKIYQWKGKEIDLSEEKCNEYKKKVVKIFFKDMKLSDNDINNMECINEIPMEESDEFLDLI